MPKKKSKKSKKKIKISAPLTTDDVEMAGKVYDKDQLMSAPEKEVRENEDTSLQDDTYVFDEDNTGNDDFHDAMSIEQDESEKYV